MRRVGRACSLLEDRNLSKGHDGSLSARKAPSGSPIRIYLLHPISNRPLRDAAGHGAYVDVLPLDSVAAEDALASSAGGAETVAALELLVALTTGWRWVDYAGAPAMSASVHGMTTREFYSSPELAWVRRQVAASLVFAEGAQQCRP